MLLGTIPLPALSAGAGMRAAFNRKTNRMRTIRTKILVQSAAPGFLTIALQVPDGVSEEAALGWLHGSAGGLTSVYRDRIDWREDELDFVDACVAPDNDDKPAETIELVCMGEKLGAKLPDSPYAYALSMAGIIGKGVSV